jgi:hypothetical protein
VSSIRKIDWVLAVLMPVAFVFSSLGQALAGAAPPPECQRVMDEIALGKLGPENLDLDKSGGGLCFWEFALTSVTHVASAVQAQAKVQKSSATSQTGAPTGSNGTTSAVSKPNTPLSLATEYGGITSSTSNQTMTLQTTLDGIPYALATHTAPYCWSPVVTIPGCISASNLQWLNRIGLGITANTSTSSQNVTGTAAPSQTTAQEASLKTAGNTAPSLSSAFTKITILRGKIQQVDFPSGIALEKNGDAITQVLEQLPTAVMDSYGKWQRDCLSQFTTKNLVSDATGKPDAEKEAAYFAKYYAQIVDILFKKSPEPPNCSAGQDRQFIPAKVQAGNLQTWQKDLVDKYANYVASLSLFEALLDKAVLAAAKPALALEYDYNTPVNQPTTSTVKLVYSQAGLQKMCGARDKKPPSKSAVQAVTSAPATDKDSSKKKAKCTSSTDSTCINQLTGTLNAGGNFYNSTPSNVPGAQTFRDVQVGAEVDWAFCTSAINVIGSFLGNSTLGLTYYYQDQTSPSILKVTPGMPVSGINIVGLASTTSSVFATKGPINFVQLKYGLGTGKNVKFPIAFSYSNRTDLITKQLWSAQFGVSYDFSSLLNSSSSSNSNSSKGSGGDGGGQ